MDRSSLPVRYGIAVLVVALALLLKLALDSLFTEHQSPFLMLAGAVMVAAWFGGLGPGLLATGLGALAADYFFLDPVHVFTPPGLSFLPLFLFGVQGVLISALAQALRSARQRAEQSTLEARRSEERFRLLVEGVKDYAVYLLDPEGCVATWNEGAQRINGYRASEIIGEHFSRFYTEADVKRGHPEEELRIAAEEGRHEEEGLRVRKDGSTFWASVFITALRDEEGNLRGFSKVVHDVTERKRSEAALRRSFDSLLALYEAGRILSSTLEREEIGARLLEVTRRVPGLEAAIIDLPDERGRISEWRSVGTDEVLTAVRERSEVRSAVERVSKGGRARSLELEGAQPLTGVFLPLQVRGQEIGVLEAYGSKALTGKEPMETLSSLASQAASALENARLYEELAERERELHDLVGRLMVAQEEERRRLAYDVHDGFTQMAAAAYRRLALFADNRPPEDPRDREELEDALALVKQTVGEARRVIADLRPTTLDDFGLATAVRLQVEALRSEGFDASYEETLGAERLSATLETALFRVAQEALANARKHAGSNRVHVELGRRNGSVRLEIRDWGRGFEPAKVRQGGSPGERVGLSSMQERIALLGGSLEIHSESGTGTSVVAEVPLGYRGGEAKER